eukprot:Nk52_evm25s967 gene=Nk52_evmTU25s967
MSKSQLRNYDSHVLSRAECFRRIHKVHHAEQQGLKYTKQMQRDHEREQARLAAQRLLLEKSKNDSDFNNEIKFVDWSWSPSMFANFIACTLAIAVYAQLYWIYEGDIALFEAHFGFRNVILLFGSLSMTSWFLSLTERRVSGVMTKVCSNLLRSAHGVDEVGLPARKTELQTGEFVREIVKSESMASAYESDSGVDVSSGTEVHEHEEMEILLKDLRVTVLDIIKKEVSPILVDVFDRLLPPAENIISWHYEQGDGKFSLVLTSPMDGTVNSVGPEGIGLAVGVKFQISKEISGSIHSKESKISFEHGSMYAKKSWLPSFPVHAISVEHNPDDSICIRTGSKLSFPVNQLMDTINDISWSFSE